MVTTMWETFTNCKLSQIVNFHKLAVNFHKLAVNFHKLVGKNFNEENFVECSTGAAKEHHVPKFCRENFRKEPQNFEICKRSFPLYGR